MQSVNGGVGGVSVLTVCANSGESDNGRKFEDVVKRWRIAKWKGYRGEVHGMKDTDKKHGIQPQQRQIRQRQRHRGRRKPCVVTQPTWSPERNPASCAGLPACRDLM